MLVRIKVRLRDDSAWYLAHPWCSGHVDCRPFTSMFTDGPGGLTRHQDGLDPPTMPPLSLALLGVHRFAYSTSSPSCLCQHPANL